MKLIQGLLSIACVLALILILLITSVEAAVYWTPGFFEKEYDKYQVTKTVGMAMPDLLAVTDEMMDYLRGERADLIVPTVVNGESREFFNAREIAHMEDVRGLFVGALRLRLGLLVFLAVALIVLKLLRTAFYWVLPRAICAGTGLFIAAVALLAGIISTDFTKYFTIFHEIFFNNDLWILDPRTDLLINIVPEPFFVDTAAYIATLFGGTLLLMFVSAVVVIRIQKLKHTQ